SLCHPRQKQLLNLLKIICSLSLAPTDFYIQRQHQKGQDFKIAPHIKQHQIIAMMKYQTQIATNQTVKTILFLYQHPRETDLSVLQVAEFSSLKFKLDQDWHRLSQRYKLQPRVIRVTAYKNGSRTVFAKVTVPTITLECTEKLNLNMAARRVFLADGTEALEPEDIPCEADVYVSTGEPFLDPFKKIK
ncbi:hypothetical protein EI555_008066, partial [Monodon monoceros]